MTHIGSVLAQNAIKIAARCIELKKLEIMTMNAFAPNVLDQVAIYVVTETHVQTPNVLCGLWQSSVHRTLNYHRLLLGDAVLRLQKQEIKSLVTSTTHGIDKLLDSPFLDVAHIRKSCLDTH